MFTIIFFAIKVFVAAILIIPLFLSKNSVISRDHIGVYIIVAIVSAIISSIAHEMNSGLIVAALFVAVGIVSLSQFQKEDNWQDALQSIAPFWLVAVIGMCVGAWKFWQAIILTAVSFYIINYLPLLLGRDQRKNNLDK